MVKVEQFLKWLSDPLGRLGFSNLNRKTVQRTVLCTVCTTRECWAVHVSLYRQIDKQIGKAYSLSIIVITVTCSQYHALQKRRIT